MSQSNEGIKQFLVFAYQVLNAHHAQISQMQNSIEVIEDYLRNPTGDYQNRREETFRRIALREQPPLASGTLSTADSIAAMLKLITNL